MPFQTRAQIRLEIIGMLRMLSMDGIAHCYLCQNLGSDVHEIISRNRTQYNDEAREASFQKELCAWLCDPCHSNKAVRKDVQKELLLTNMALYGYEAVKTAFDAIPDRMKLGIDFPTKEEHLKQMFGHFEEISKNVMGDDDASK